MSIPLCILGQPLVGVELLAAADVRSVRALTGNPDDTRVIARFSWHRSLNEVCTRSSPAAEDAAAWELIPGATRPTYRCAPADAGRWLRVTVVPLSASAGGQRSAPPSSGGARDSMASSGSFGQGANRPLLRAVAGPIQQAPAATSDAARAQQAQLHLQQQLLPQQQQAQPQEWQLAGQSSSQPSPRLRDDPAASRRFVVDCEYAAASEGGHVVRVHLSPRHDADDRGTKQSIVQQLAAGLRQTSSPGRLLSGTFETSTDMAAALYRRRTSPGGQGRQWSDGPGRPPPSLHKDASASVQSHHAGSPTPLGRNPAFTFNSSPRDSQPPQQQHMLPPKGFPPERWLDAQEALALQYPTALRVQFQEHNKQPPPHALGARRVSEPPPQTDHPFQKPRAVSEASAGAQLRERHARSPPRPSRPGSLEGWQKETGDHPAVRHSSMERAQQEANYMAMRPRSMERRQQETDHPAVRHPSMQGGQQESGDHLAMRPRSMQAGQQGDDNVTMRHPSMQAGQQGTDHPATRHPSMGRGQQEADYPSMRPRSMERGQQEADNPAVRHPSLQGGEEMDRPAMRPPSTKRRPDWNQDSAPGPSTSASAREPRWASLPGSRSHGDGPHSGSTDRGEYEEFLQMARAAADSRNSSRQRGASSPGGSFRIRSVSGGVAAEGLQRPPLAVPPLRPDSSWGDMESYQARAHAQHAVPGPIVSQQPDAHRRPALSVQLPSPQQQPFGDSAATVSPSHASPLPQPLRLDRAFLAMSLNAGQEQASSQGGSGPAGGWQGAGANRRSSTSGGGSSSVHSGHGSVSLQEALEQLLAQHQEVIQQVASDKTETDRDQNAFRMPSGPPSRSTISAAEAPLPPQHPTDNSIGGNRLPHDAAEGPVQPLPHLPQQSSLTGSLLPSVSSLASSKPSSGNSESSSVSLAVGLSDNSTKASRRSLADTNERSSRASDIGLGIIPSSPRQTNIPDRGSLRLVPQESEGRPAPVGAGSAAGGSGNSMGGLGDEYLNNLLRHAALLEAEAEAVRAAVMSEDDDGRSRMARSSQNSAAAVPGAQQPGDPASDERRGALDSILQTGSIPSIRSGGMKAPSGATESSERPHSTVVGIATQTSGGGVVAGGQWTGKESLAGTRPRMVGSSSSSARDMRDMNEALSNQLAESMRLQLQMQTALAAAMNQLTSLNAKDQPQQHQRRSPQRASPSRSQHEADSDRSVCVTANAQDAASGSVFSPPRQRTPLLTSKLRETQSASINVGSGNGVLSSPTFGLPSPISPRRATICVVESRAAPAAQQRTAEPDLQPCAVPNTLHIHASVQTHGAALTHTGVQTVNSVVANFSKSTATEEGGQVPRPGGADVSSTTSGAAPVIAFATAPPNISVGVSCVEGPSGGVPLPSGGAEVDTVSVAAMRELLHQHHLRWRAKKSKLKEQAQAWQYTAWRYATAWKKARAMLEAMVAMQGGGVPPTAAAGLAAATAHAPAHPQPSQPDPSQCCPPPNDFHPLAPPAGPTVVPTRLDAHASGMPGTDPWQLNPPAVMAGIAAALQRRRDREQGRASERPQALVRPGASRATSCSPNAAMRGDTTTGDKLLRVERPSPDRMHAKAPSQRKRFIGHSVASYGATDDTTCYSQSAANTIADRDVGPEVRPKVYPGKDVGAYFDDGLDLGRLRDQGSRGRSSSAGRSRNGVEAIAAGPEVAAHWPATLRIRPDGSRSRSPSPPVGRPPWRNPGTISPPGGRPIRVKQDSVGTNAGFSDMPAWPTVCPPEPPQPFQQLKPPNAPCRDPDGWWQYPDGWLDIYNPRPPHMLVQHANAKRHHHPRYSDGQGQPASNEIDKAVHPT